MIIIACRTVLLHFARRPIFRSVMMLDGAFFLSTIRCLCLLLCSFVELAVHNEPTPLLLWNLFFCPPVRFYSRQLARSSKNNGRTRSE